MVEDQPSPLFSLVLEVLRDLGLHRVDDDRYEDVFKLRPREIIEYLDLRRPIYRRTAAYGHFGRTESEFTWERTDRAAEIRLGGRTLILRLPRPRPAEPAGRRPPAAPPLEER